MDLDTGFSPKEDDLETVKGLEGLDVKFRLRVLADLLTCYVCGGFFHSATTVKECLHTFCHRCVHSHFMRAIAVGASPRCPRCDEDMPAQFYNAVQPDIRIQNLVDKLFPEFQKQETAARDKVAKLLNPKEAGHEDSRDGDAAPLPGSEHPMAVDATLEFLSHISKGTIELQPEKLARLLLVPGAAGQPSLLCPFLTVAFSAEIRQLRSHVAEKLGISSEDVDKVRAEVCASLDCQVEIVFDSAVLAHSHSIEFVL
eukprot:Polyplicarium_translucidae@DN2677_c0_g1_i3.p2